MCYNADILILKTANTACPSGPLTVEYHPKDMPTAVEISLDSKRYKMVKNDECSLRYSFYIKPSSHLFITSTLFLAVVKIYMHLEYC